LNNSSNTIKATDNSASFEVLDSALKIILFRKKLYILIKQTQYFFERILAIGMVISKTASYNTFFIQFGYLN